jgi:glycerol-3-phosphate dehydrogenase
MIPSEVDILGKRYVVEITQREGGDEEGSDDYGQCRSDQCRIEVANYQCDEQKRDTLLHEIMHGVDHEMHCNMSEAMIRRMATGLLQVLRHNPDLVAFLVESNATPAA